MRNYLCAILVALNVATAADSHDWNAVGRIAPGTPVEVIHSALKRSSGSLLAVTPDEVTLETAAGPQVLSRGSVRRVSITGSSRKRRALVGMAIGAGAGAAALALGASSGDIDIRRDLVAGAGAAIGGAAGAAVGAASGGSRTVYRSNLRTP